MNDAAQESRARAAAELALLRRYREKGDRSARDELVAMLLPWVRRVASRYGNRGQDPDDLVQVGSVGLLKAIERYDFDRGVRLTTFAEPNVTGEIKRYFRDHGWSVRPPRDLQELNGAVTRCVNALSSDLQRSPTISEIAEYLKVSDEDVLEAMHAGAAYDSAPLEIEDAESDTTFQSAALAVSDPGLDQAELRETLDVSLTLLSERDREVLRLRFYEDLTQSEIAERVGISQMQVSRILRAALQAVRAQIDPDEGGS